jgi:hypothetical protein
MLSSLARPGTPLHRIMTRRLRGAANSGYMAPGAYGTPSMGSATATPSTTVYPNTYRYTGDRLGGNGRYRYTGVGSTGGGGSTYGVMRGDFQMGGYPTGGGPHFSPGTNLSPDLRFGRAVSTVNGYDLNHPSIPESITNGSRLRVTSRADSVGVRGPW